MAEIRVVEPGDDSEFNRMSLKFVRYKTELWDWYQRAFENAPPLTARTILDNIADVYGWDTSVEKTKLESQGLLDRPLKMLDFDFGQGETVQTEIDL